VRDTGSRALAEQLGIDAELPVVPDLAFALQARPRLRPRRPGYDVALSPMVYLRPGLWPKENRAEYERFVALWADLATERVKCGDRVHLFVSDPADMEAVHDVCKLLDDDVRSACEIVDAATPNDLLEFFRRIDVVISSRLHGVLLAIVAERPVLALSHERKVRTLMRDAGVAEFCTELPGSTADDVLDRLDGLLTELESCGRTLADYAAVARAAVTRQENLLPGLLRRR
jgi:polysaccharide pyruvyl transferase WcaK-like protein